MRKARAIALLLVISVPALAGDVNVPGKQDPPPCSQNCSNPVSTTETVKFVILELMLTLIKK